MYKLVRICDDIQIAPSVFGEPRGTVLENEVNRKYANRVLEGHGLCVCVWDWISWGDARILDGHGEAQICVEFRLIVFAPFEGEVLLGRVRSSNSKGIHLSLDFFDDVFVEEKHMQKPSEFDDSEGAWVWRFDGNDLYIYNDEYVWFKVLDVVYKQPESKDSVEASLQSPMQIRATLAGDGLGIVTWWSSIE
eukprot:Plantae.Rhodophyta-Purpureofilum_apyrenoidigerum.ctg19365.p1 GENE.Plantae.Rhodophyta-Purpureofilum_apyrenoidigerum.ctg19365~~Plantae.Rhodophyta-Purpureofilum_apyrenoidigerum.ctg19365.p1  ORF type:complete len:192 (-),score=43.79 Plantae.Rhodophyta-Purpureofilum_apyrenoidigerum.ctg19365:411-986(-)